jgi:hypothetical protein
LFNLRHPGYIIARKEELVRVAERRGREVSMNDRPLREYVGVDKR